MKRLTILLVMLAGCVSTSQVGPFVKHVVRNGDWLVVHKCMIVLEGDHLSERGCTVEQVPLRTIPMQPAQPGTPAQPPVPPTPPPAPVATPRR